MSSKTTTASLLATKVKVNNILELSLVQSALEINFKAIIQAISDHDGDINKLIQNCKNNSDKITSLQSYTHKNDAQIQDINNKINQLINGQQSIKSKLTEKDNQPNPQTIHNSELENLLKDINALKAKTNKLEDNLVKNMDNAKFEVDKLKRDMQESTKNVGQANKIKQLQKMLKESQGKNKQLGDKLQSMQGKVVQMVKKQQQKQNKNSDMNKVIEQMNNKLKEFINEEYKQRNQQNKETINNLNKIIQQMKASLEQQKRMRNKLSQQTWKMNDSVSKLVENNFQKEMGSDVVKQLKKDIAQLQKKLGLKSFQSPSKHTVNQTTAESPSKWKDNQSNELTNDIREQLNEKIKQLRADFMKNLRKIDIRTDQDSGLDKQKIQALEDAILRLNHIIQDKADTATVKKMVEASDGKMSYIYSVVMGDSEQDASIAKKNWVCLSCDKKLDKYQGKLGQHLVNDKLLGRTLDQDAVGGGMALRPSKSKYDLPNVYSKTAKKLT